MTRIVVIRFSLVCLFCFSSHISAFVLAVENEESNFYRELLGDAYQGTWHALVNKSLPYDGFSQKNGRQWMHGAASAFTGWYAQFDLNSTARLLCSFYDGIREGPVVYWDEVGRIALRGAYQSGKKHGVFTGWNTSGVRTSEKEYENGKLDGWAYFWYDKGQLRLRLLFEVGKLIEATGWLPDGRICPHTQVEKGSGVIIHHKDGAKLPRKLGNELKVRRSRAKL